MPPLVSCHRKINIEVHATLQNLYFCSKESGDFITLNKQNRKIGNE